MDVDADLQARLRRHAEELEAAARPVGADEARLGAPGAAPAGPRRWSGWVTAAAAATVLVVGLGLAGGIRQGGDAEAGPDPAGLADDLEVEVLPVGGEVVHAPVVRTAGGGLVARTTEGVDGAGVAVSDDGGRTWQSAALPGAPDGSGSTLSELVEVDGVAVLRATVGAPLAPEDVYVWTSTDGATWEGGLLEEAVLGYVPVGELDGGIALVTGAGRRVAVLRSPDGGATWDRHAVDAGAHLAFDRWRSLLWDGADGAWYVRIGDVDDQWASHVVRSDDGGATWAAVDACGGDGSSWSAGCHPVRRAGDLTVRGLETSRDGGGTWTAVTLAGGAPPQQHIEDSIAFSSVRELPGGGWIGTILEHGVAGGGDVAWVVRSDDGTSWTTLLGPGLDGCKPSASDIESPWFHALEPALLDGRWLLAYACPGADGPGTVDLFVADGRATARHPLGLDLQPDQDLGQPVAVDDAVLVPVLDDRGAVVSMVTVR